jgi:benzoylformate decarboxylase
LLGDLHAGLVELDALLAERLTPERNGAIERRRREHAERHRACRGKLQAQAERERDARPLSPLSLLDCVGSVLPANAAVVEEAVTTTNTYLERLGKLRDPSGYFGHRGWALGWGLGCALGVKIAWPDRPVLALLGDGAALYGIQGLWTAAHYQLPVTFLVCNNAQYQILKVGARGMGLPAAQAGRFLGLDIVDPEIDFVGLARSLGVASVRISERDALADALRHSLAGDRPLLIDVPISRDLPGQLKYT